MCSPYIREKVINTYFDRNKNNNVLTAKAILLDMEPKVIQKCLDSRNQEKKEHQWAYDPNMAYFKQGGSGNNWALGYQYLDDEVYHQVSVRM